MVVGDVAVDVLVEPVTAPVPGGVVVPPPAAGQTPVIAPPSGSSMPVIPPGGVSR